MGGQEGGYLEDIEGSWLETWMTGSFLTPWMMLFYPKEPTLKVSDQYLHLLWSYKRSRSKWPTSERRERRERELKLTLPLPSGVVAGVGQGWRNFCSWHADPICWSNSNQASFYKPISCLWINNDHFRIEFANMILRYPCRTPTAMLPGKGRVNFSSLSSLSLVSRLVSEVGHLLLNQV